MLPRRILASLVLLAVASDALAVELVRSGKGMARIVVAANAPQAERFAASEFQAHIALMSGARLPIASNLAGKPTALVLVGQGAARLAGRDVLEATRLDEIRGDGYVLTVLDAHKPPCIVLLGRQPRGTLYAVYDFLETTFGCGFFSDGNRVPRRPDVAAYGPDMVGNPAFGLRACRVPTRFYGPKRFQPTLWSADDWKRFLRWMARKKMNCLAIEFDGATRAWGEAFDKAFPEAKGLKRETIAPADQPPTPGPTVRMGWGLGPAHVTTLWKDVFAYARTTLGLEVLFVLRLGEFELPLKLAHPKLRWLPARPESFFGAAGQSPVLAHADPECRELQAKLWKSIIQTYGTDHRYLVTCPTHAAAAGASKQGPNPVAVATEILRGVDPKANILISTADNALWGQTHEDKTAFLRKLPPGIGVVYAQTGFPGDALLRATERFAGRPFHYASLWGVSYADLFQYSFDSLRTQFHHSGAVPPPRPVGFANWCELRGTNPLMDNLCAEFAWTGRNVWRSEGASNNPQTRLYLTRRYSQAAVFPLAEAFKQGVRAAPRTEPGVNFRAYVRWSDIAVEGTEAARGAVTLALSCKPVANDSPFYESDILDLGRNYLHQYIEERYGQIVALVRDAKRAAQAGAYNPNAKAKTLARLKTLGDQLRQAHTTLTRLIATRKDMCLDDAILEAVATPGANRNLARAIREHQSGAFANGIPLTDSLEYHQQLKRPQMDAFLKYAHGETNAPTAKPLPAWQQFFLHGTQQYIRDAKPVPYARKAERARASDILGMFLQAVD